MQSDVTFQKWTRRPIESLDVGTSRIHIKEVGGPSNPPGQSSPLLADAIRGAYDAPLQAIRSMPAGKATEKCCFRSKDRSVCTYYRVHNMSLLISVGSLGTDG